MTVVSIYVVFADDDEAERIGRQMVEERLAACVNVFPAIRSVYRWKDEVEDADEAAAIFKTSDERADALMTRIAGLHSYEVPCIVSSSVDKIFASYAGWVEDSTG